MKRYSTPTQILLDFVPLRMRLYQKRHAHMLAVLRADVGRIQNTHRFVGEVVDGRLRLMNTPRAEVIERLRELKFDDVQASWV